MVEIIEKRIKAATGAAKPDFVLKNGNIIDVFSQKILNGDIAICGDRIVGIGNYDGEVEYELNGAYVAPGFIDAHVHIESSMVTPLQFSKAVAPHGTTAVVADPHEIANVTGLEGINYILDSSKNLPVEVFLMLPSCVPTSAFETAGADLGASRLRKLINEPNVLGLGEMMNYPGVLDASPKILRKLDLAEGKIVDGHAPRLSGKSLAGYIAAGIKTDHECETPEELKERVGNGMYVLLREGSAAKNVASLVKGITPENMRRCCFCTDDRHPEDIIQEGSVDNNIRVAVKNGLDPLLAITMATLNPAECYGLKLRGAIAPGYLADLVVMDNLKDFNILETYKAGKLCSKNGKLLWELNDVKKKMKNTINCAPVSKESIELKIKPKLNGTTANIIELIPNSIITKKSVLEVGTKNGGIFTPETGSDILKLIVVERHYSTGNIGMGLVKGFGLKNGAIASTVAHDSHNIICVGDNDADILAAITEIERVHGGVTLCGGGKVIETLPLPVAGLMSQEPLENVAQQLHRLKIAAMSMGVPENINPFMTLAFLALPVIPEIKLTDKGLFDVENFEFMDI